MSGETLIALGSGMAGILLGGLGTALVQSRLVVSADRRIRADRERSDALYRLVQLASQLEGQVAYMLSPNARSADGIFHSGTWIYAEQILTSLRACWREDAEPLLGGEERALYEAVQSSWSDAESAWLAPAAAQNPPPTVFWTKLEELGSAVERFRARVQRG